MVVPIRDIENKALFTSAITNKQPNMNLLPNMGIVIDNFGGGNVNNFDKVRGCSITSNKSASRTVSISSSKVLVEYAIRLEHLNDNLDNDKNKDLIDSSQLSYAELKEIQVNWATNHENKIYLQ